jgi:hypothetical protein
MNAFARSPPPLAAVSPSQDHFPRQGDGAIPETGLHAPEIGRVSGPFSVDATRVGNFSVLLSGGVRVQESPFLHKMLVGS